MPDDYDPPLGFGVTFPAAGLSLMGDTMQCATIQTTDDEVLEGEHDFMVMVDSVTPDVVTIGAPSSQTATLLDDESKLCIVLWVYRSQKVADLTILHTQLELV